jgi:DNA (cytosine-5)-methyltransferase 1
MRLTAGSLFDGIGCYALGLERAGLEVRWAVEIDARCRKVTAAHFPGARQYGDIKDVGDDFEAIDVLVGASPCQGLSVAGRRKGLADERSGLFGEMARVADRLSPRWVVWENVPGALSSAKGEDFACVLEALTGYRPAVPKKTGQYKGGWQNSGACFGPKRSCAWRVLDVHGFDLAQRRPRLFLVARAGDGGGLLSETPWPRQGRLRGLPLEVLFEPDSLLGHPSEGRGEGPRHAAGPEGGPRGGRQLWQNNDSGSGYRLGDPTLLSSDDNGTNQLVVEPVAFAQNQRQEVRDLGDKAGSLAAQPGMKQQTYVAYAELGEGHVTYRETDVANALRTSSGGGGPMANLAVGMTVRRLTPTECLRLMGLPDDWLDGFGLSDTRKYHMVGNGGSPQVMEYIARGILEVEGEDASGLPEL